MAIEIFNRVENKYMILDHQVNLLNETLNSQMISDHQGENPYYSISNIYYDTIDDYLIKHSLSKPEFKEKLRIRAYGNVTKESMVFIELKKKYKGIVNKRRSKIRLKDAYKFLETRILPKIEPYHNALVLREIQFFLTRYSLIPSTIISYDRWAYKKDGFRVTVDHNIRTRTEDLKLEHGSYGALLLEDNLFLLEAKSDHGFPLWFVYELSSLGIYKTSFSKYGKDFTRRNQTIKERGVNPLCWTQYSATLQKRQSL